MSRALAVYHGEFGRASLYQLDRDMATHAHREGHLIFYVSGQHGGVRVDDEPFGLTPDAGVAINPWQPHSFHAGDLHKGSVFLVLYIRPEWFLKMAQSRQVGLKFGSARCSKTRAVTNLVERVSAALLEGSQSDLFDGYLYELTQECFDQSWQSADGLCLTGSQDASLRDFRIRNSIKLMRSRLDEGESTLLESIARGAGISRPHFFKLFKENVGLTPNIYLNTLRMESAIDRLTLSGEAVTSIGLDLGFSSQASFTRFFVSNVGIPPSDYRRVAHLAA